MNPYLAKLRLRDETHYPYGPSKPSKPILPVADHANTTGETGFEGFEGDLSRCLPENEAAADRSRSDPFGRLGRTYAALAARSPEHVPADRWQSVTSSPGMAAMNLEFHALSKQLSPRLDGVALEWLVLPKNR
jgi:hypothetical protein